MIRGGAREEKIRSLFSAGLRQNFLPSHSLDLFSSRWPEKSTATREYSAELETREREGNSSDEDHGESSKQGHCKYAEVTLSPENA